MDFGTMVVNLSILVNLTTGEYLTVNLPMSKRPMFTSNALYNLKKQTLKNSLNSKKKMRDLMKKNEPVHFSFEVEQWLEFKHYIAKKNLMTKPKNEDQSAAMHIKKR